MRAAADSDRERSWTLTVDHLGRPTTTNKAHNMHHRAVSTDRKRWREAGCVLARAAGIPVTYRRPVVEAGSLPALIVLVREGEGR